MSVQLSMVVLEVRDLSASIEFYRNLGVDVPDPSPDRRVVVHRMESGVSLVLTESFAARYDPEWARPAGGYQVMMEFFLGDDDGVDNCWSNLVSAGYHGRMPPTRTAGPYAAMIDDPDGNVVLLTSDPGPPERRPS